MERKLVYKMIRSSMKQYYHGDESFPLTEKDYEDLYKRVVAIKRSAEETELHEVIQDVVYEFLTN